LGLVEDHVVAAVRTLAAGELVRADVDRVAAGTVDFFAGKEAGFGFGVFPTVGAFNDEFGHIIFPPDIL